MGFTLIGSALGRQERIYLPRAIGGLTLGPVGQAHKMGGVGRVRLCGRGVGNKGLRAVCNGVISVLQTMRAGGVRSRWAHELV